MAGLICKGERGPASGQTWASWGLMAQLWVGEVNPRAMGLDKDSILSFLMSWVNP